jgi:radical SAM protein (TIGR01212 family)
MNPKNFPWNTERRFNAIAEHNKKKYGGRLQKLSINAGFTCPNRDGSITTGGCTFCNNKAFSPSYCEPQTSIEEQIKKGLNFHKKRYKKAENFLAYFQSFSNTYASLEKLKELYESALKFDEIKGLVLGTRPDCIDEEKLDYLAELNKKYFIHVEYGIESCYNQTLDRINRGHTFGKTAEAIMLTAMKEIHVGGHLILGLPGETKEMMLKQATFISKLPLNSLKLHQLQIFKNTPMEKEFEDKRADFHVFEKDEYIDFVIDFLELLSPDIFIERLAGEVPPKYLAGPSWGLRHELLLLEIEQRMEERDSWQGKMFRY